VRLSPPRGGVGGTLEVSWDDIQGFPGVANAGAPGKGLRLPSEAEWEYFARAGTKTRYWRGAECRKGKASCDERLVEGESLQRQL